MVLSFLESQRSPALMIVGFVFSVSGNISHLPRPLYHRIPSAHIHCPETKILAVRAHFRPHRWRQAICYIIGNTHGKCRHELFYFSPADGTVYLGVHAHNKPVKFVVTFFTVIFIKWHRIPPIGLNLSKDKIAFI